jgi:hypothetical protein
VAANTDEKPILLALLIHKMNEKLIFDIVGLTSSFVCSFESCLWAMPLTPHKNSKAPPCHIPHFSFTLCIVCVFILLLPSVSFAHAFLTNEQDEISSHDWVRQQITQDLGLLSKKSIKAKELRKRFAQLAKQTSLLLYCKIDKNKVSWKTSPELSDWYKVFPIFEYFSDLSKIKNLPDTEFIFCIEDGIAVESQGDVLSQNYLLKGQQPLPIFGFAKTKNMANVLLLPDWNMFAEILNPKEGLVAKAVQFAKTNPWHLKREMAFFRGSVTGYLDNAQPYFGNQRVRLVAFSHAHPDLVDAGLTSICWDSVQAWYRDHIGEIPQKSPHEELFSYKYLLDIDGNASTFERCRLLLLSNSVLLKIESPFEQWYYKVLVPWKNYVPIKQDFSDLETILDFLKSHDELAKAIANSGHQMQHVFSKEKVDEYIWHLLWEYSTYVQVKRSH